MASTSSTLVLLSLFSIAFAGCDLDRSCLYESGDKIASWRCHNDKTVLVDIGDGGKILQVTHCDDCYFLVEQHKTGIIPSNYYRVKMFHLNGQLKDITSGRFLAKCYYQSYPHGVGGAGSHDFKVNIDGALKGAGSVKSGELTVGVETTLTTLQKSFAMTWPDGEVTNCGAYRCACSGPYRCEV